ncbi:amidohydrolase family protein [Candidatus Alkanophaga liquidiphilum]|nr:Formylmethanofuran dehydrogenase subunit A [Candidatus Alkanophaga liquidiphilum]
MRLHVKNARVYDPINGINGELADIFIEDGVIVEETHPEKIIDAKGKAAMAGGIDVHSHVATYGLTLARFSLGFPTLPQIAETYARLGFTHVNEPLASVITAAYTHHELSSIPLLDASTLAVLDMLDFLKIVRESDEKEAKNAILFILDATKAITAKIYEPFVSLPLRIMRRLGIEGMRMRLSTDTVLKFFSRLSGDDSVPKIHLHATPPLLKEDVSVLSTFHISHLGTAINEENQEAAFKLLELQTPLDLGIFLDEHFRTAEQNFRLATRREITPRGRFLSIAMNFSEPLIISKSEADRKNASEALQRTEMSLTLALRALNRLEGVCFSTDSPNGSLFHDYPKIFAILLSRENRKELKERGVELPSEEYTLYELAAITRSEPAAALRLDAKGHLGVGADADVVLYDITEDTPPALLEKKLSNCEMLIKSGVLVIHNGKLLTPAVSGVRKKTHFSHIEVSADMENAGKRLLNKKSFRFEHLRVNELFMKPEL